MNKSSEAALLQSPSLSISFLFHIFFFLPLSFPPSHSFPARLTSLTHKNLVPVLFTHVGPQMSQPGVEVVRGRGRVGFEKSRLALIVTIENEPKGRAINRLSSSAPLLWQEIRLWSATLRPGSVCYYGDTAKAVCVCVRR